LMSHLLFPILFGYFVNFADGESFSSEEKIKNILMRLKIPLCFGLKKNMIRWEGKIDLDVCIKVWELAR
jgi:hypothetical protein